MPHVYHSAPPRQRRPVGESATMAELIERTWQPQGVDGLPRRDRTGCDYLAYVPDPLADREFSLAGTTAADVADAEAAVARLNGSVTALADTEALARLLLRAEAVASSHIEGLQVGARRLLRVEATGAGDRGASDVTAVEVLGNIEAMDVAVHLTEGPVTPGDVLEMHRRLLSSTDRHAHAGRFRDQQNWIGGSSYNPCSAAFVPPPEGEVPALMEDLCAFVNGDSLPAVAQAAVAHAQFETIHPFVDGNGRTGRALVHVVLRRRGLAPRVVPPISLILATRADDYVAGLTDYRYVGPADGPAATAGINRWIAAFAAATTAAAVDAERFEAQITALKQTWRDRLRRPRAGSASAELVDRLPGAPVVTVGAVAEMLGRTYKAANDAVARFEAAGILTPIGHRRRHRAWEASEIIEAFTSLERSLASPTGDTRTAGPARPVPARRR
ncbi:MAG TPA: Fic family protein [Acidimicrobiales bacterium]